MPSPGGEKVAAGRMRGGTPVAARLWAIAGSSHLISPLRGQLPLKGKPFHNP